jgi:hypothetical protein
MLRLLPGLRAHRDVRRAEAFERDPRLIPGAICHTPDIAEWHVALEPSHVVVVYPSALRVVQSG